MLVWCKSGKFLRNCEILFVISVCLFVLFFINTSISRADSGEGILFFPIGESDLVSSNIKEIVVVDRFETFSIMLPLNLVSGYQWMLDTATLRPEVLSEVGTAELTGDDIGIPDGNDAESEYVQWTFVAKESGSCNLLFNYKNISDGDIYSICEVSVTVLAGPDERPAAFSLVVFPGKMSDTITGQKCVFLVKVIDEGPGFGKAEPVNISAINLAGGFDTVVNVEPNVICPGEVCEVTIIPGKISEENGDDPNIIREKITEDEEKLNEPEDSFEYRECVVTITAERNGVVREQMVRLDVYPGEDLFDELPASYRDRFIPWLEVNYPELGITSETIWEGTIVKPRILVVMYYLFFCEQWEMGLRWHVTIPPYDWAEIYLRKRGEELSSTYAFKISSLALGEEPQVVGLPPEGIFR